MLIELQLNLPFVSVSKLNAKSLLERRGHGSGPWSSSSNGLRTQTRSSLAKRVACVLPLVEMGLRILKAEEEGSPPFSLNSLMDGEQTGKITG